MSVYTPAEWYIPHQEGWRIDRERDANEFPALTAKWRERYGEYVPWPFRCSEDRLPEKCPKCGRTLRLRYWGLGDTRYWELTCASRFTHWLAAKMQLPSYGHYHFNVSRSTRMR